MTAFRTPRRALHASAVLVVLVAALLAAWFYSGWHDVRARQQEVRSAPRRAAGERATALARELHSQLDALIAREVRRPYFHYQNLMHDPDASPGLNVSPSPLARGVEDPLVLGYFQLTASGQVSTPTINDDVPSLSEPEQRAAHQLFRTRVTQDLSSPLVALLPAPPRRANTRRASQPRPAVTSTARSTPPPAAPRTSPMPVVQAPSQPPLGDPVVTSPTVPTVSGAQQTQVIQVDPRVYSQNVNPNQVYSQQSSALATLSSLPSQRTLPTAGVQAPAAASPPAAPAPAPPLPPITITISPLEWQTFPFDGAPSLVAVRHVHTPDGTLAQGFVVNRWTIANWVGSRTDGMIADLSPDTAGGADVVAGWRLAVTPRSQQLSQADVEAEGIARTFLVQFFAIATLAAGAAAFVVLLVRRAEALALERSRFAAAAAHELRTPLAGLRLYGDLLADGLGDPEKMRDYARRMSEEAARLGRVVSNVLAFSQLERDQLRMEARPGSLSDALRELADAAHPAIQRSGATLRVDVAPELRARFDRDALARIVANLLDNAEKYSRDAADRTILLSARADGDSVEVTVEDRGHGVPDATTLFKPFARGTNGTDNPAGLGLGLALSRAQARAMGGELLYAPREGGGARFVLRLPA